MGWETGPNGDQVYVPDPEEQDPNWCFAHDAMYPACEDGTAEQ